MNLHNPELEEQTEAMGKKIMGVILFLAAIVIGMMVYRILTTPPAEKPRITTPYQEAVIREYCKTRKVKPAVIEIHYSGRMFYELDGKRCEITEAKR
jgi:hypothetical protein